ncbi:MAG: hypothetical protein RL318_1608 [Fibrobacterota bacterium]|jgi:hypothetical protein
MLSLPFLLASLSSVALPMDTGVVVQACRLPFSGDTLLVMRVWNASRITQGDLSLRFHLNGAPGSLADLGFRADLRQKVGADGFNSPIAGAAWVASTVALDPSCVGDTCTHKVDIPLSGLTLAPLEGLAVEFQPVKMSGGSMVSTKPTHVPGASDWSLAGLTNSSDCRSLADQGGIGRNLRFEVRSGTTRVWGHGPGETWDRPAWPLTDFRKASFASLMNTPADTVPVLQRDRRNRTLGNWLVNQAGYRLADVQAGRARVLGVGQSGWSVIDAAGRVLGSGSVTATGRTVSSSLRTVAALNSTLPLQDSTGGVRTGATGILVLPSSLAAGGPYRIASPTDTSAPFRIHEDLYGMVRDAGMRFFGVQRAGDASSWFRPTALAGDPVPGGWYDCGDRLKEGVTQGYSMAVLGALAATHPERDPDRTSYLQSLEVADGVPDLVRELRHGADYAMQSWWLSGHLAGSMPTSVGNMGKDHVGWIHDTWMDFAPASSGGPTSRTARREMGGPVAGSWAAGLAFAARLEKDRDPPFASQALEVSRELYAWGKANQAAVSSPSYGGDPEAASELSLAAVALLWATGDTLYLHDLTRNDSLGSRVSALWQSAGGWLGARKATTVLAKGGWPMDFANLHPLALHAFQTLILPHPDTARRYGILPARGDSLREQLMAGMLANLGNAGTGTRAVALPGTTLKIDSVWNFPIASVSWGYNRYQAGLLAEMLLYAEMARGIEARPTAHYPEGTAFLADSVEVLAVNGMDYLLGQNPWDMSFLMGIGSRNLDHIHHRAANPEGRNSLAVNWDYRTPVGALMGGAAPSQGLLKDAWSDYTSSESCLDFSVSFLIPATLLSKPGAQPPVTGVRTRASTPARVRADRHGVAWSGAVGGIELDVVDLKGRRLAHQVSVQPEGRMEIASRGVALVRWRAGNGSGTASLMPVSSGR